MMNGLKLPTTMKMSDNGHDYLARTCSNTIKSCVVDVSSCHDLLSTHRLDYY